MNYGQRPREENIKRMKNLVWSFILLKRKALQSNVKEFSWNLVGSAVCHLSNSREKILVRMKNLKCPGDKNYKTKSQLKYMVPLTQQTEFSNRRVLSMSIHLWLDVEPDWAILFRLKFPTHEPQPIWDGKSAILPVE